MDIVACDGLVKKFKDTVAVDGITLNVKEGEIFGFLGPNGAGKTTTIRMLTTSLHPTSGTVTIGGISTTEDLKEIRKHIGIVQQNVSLDKDISVRRNIIYHAMLHKIPKAEIKKRMDQLCTMMELTPFLDNLVIELSGGWKRKTAIVCSLIHQPSMLFLDEPTAGLDTQSRHILWDLIRMLNDKGTTIFLTTHYIEEAEYLCDRVAIIDKGKILQMGTPTELCEAIGAFTVEFDGESKVREYRYFPTREIAKEFAQNVGEDVNPYIRKTNLEDVFLEATGRKILGDIVKVVHI